jgi:hypothetical protein
MMMKWSNVIEVQSSKWSNEWTKKDKHNKKQRARQIKCESERDNGNTNAKKSINFLVKQNVEEKEKQAPYLCLIY